MLSTVFLGNWGLGLEILKALDQSTKVDLLLSISRYDKSNPDPWYNITYLYALENSTSVYNESELNITSLKDIIAKYEPDLLVTHAFMKILPKALFNVPKLGTVNIHASLLPAYRGPSPSYWVLHNKEARTGLTAHFMDEGVDTGAIICQNEVYIEQNETMDTVIEKLKHTAPSLVNNMLDNILQPDFQPMPQNEQLASYAPKPK
jgi:methionyl-tRNA formyltransferase